MILPMENTEKMIFPGVGKYGIPAIKPETDIRIDKLEWIPVNYCLCARYQRRMDQEYIRGISKRVCRATSEIGDSEKIGFSKRCTKKRI